MARLGEYEERGADGQVKYALVARGQAHVYLRVPHARDHRDPVWDHAAGVAIARAAGMTITDLDGRALDFAAEPTLANNFGVACAHPEVHADLLAAVADVREAESRGETL